MIPADPNDFQRFRIVCVMCVQRPHTSSVRHRADFLVEVAFQSLRPILQLCTPVIVVDP